MLANARLRLDRARLLRRRDGAWNLPQTVILRVESLRLTGTKTKNEQLPLIPPQINMWPPSSVMTFNSVQQDITRTGAKIISSESNIHFPVVSTVRGEGQIDRRSRIETFFDVLCTIGSGIEKPTHIMYKANLSWTMMQTYTSMLVKKSLVEHEEGEGKRRYRLTEKGRGVMEQYLSIKEDLDIISEKHR